ncbi:MAG: thioesterase II family protein [Flammeovirgaceae bacterium]
MRTLTHHTTKWLSSNCLKDDISNVRLFCFPYAGGGTSTYFKWLKHIPPSVTLCPIQLPGRERRIQELPYENLMQLVDSIYTDLQDLFQEPCVFFGHSMGAQIAYELAIRCQKENCKGIKHLFVSGRKPPHLFEESHQYHLLPNQEFMEQLKTYEGVPTAFFQHKELLELAIPVLRADFKMLETYTYEANNPLNVPITAFGGKADLELPEQMLTEWKFHTAARFQYFVYDGGHFFIRDYQAQILSTITLILQTTIV